MGFMGVRGPIVLQAPFLGALYVRHADRLGVESEAFDPGGESHGKYIGSRYMAGQTDRQTDKSTRWQATFYEGQYHYLTKMPHQVAEWGWQEEICPDTKRLHKQAWFRTKTQVRFSQVRQIFPGVHVEIARDWNKLRNYSLKKDSAVEGTQVHEVSTLYNQYSYAETLGQRLYDLYSHDFNDWSDKTALEHIEQHARLDIRAGHREIAWIISNPNWKVHWKFWKDIISSYSINAPPPCPPPCETP